MTFFLYLNQIVSSLIIFDISIEILSSVPLASGMYYSGQNVPVWTISKFIQFLCNSIKPPPCKGLLAPSPLTLVWPTSLEIYLLMLLELPGFHHTLRYYPLFVWHAFKYGQMAGDQSSTPYLTSYLHSFWPSVCSEGSLSLFTCRISMMPQKFPS